MKKNLLLFFVLLFFKSISLFAWGSKGHRVVGEIAKRQLSPKVKKAIAKILEGESLSSVSTWADEMKSNPDFKIYGSWHYVNLPSDKEYSEFEPEKENIVNTINKAVSILKDRKSSTDEKRFYLKYLVHLVGDIHQPLHAGRSEDLGGGKIKLKFKAKANEDNNTNLHVLWDTDLIEDFNMSFTEFSTHLINRYQHRSGLNTNFEVLSWLKESHDLATEIYAGTPENSSLSYNYVYKYHPVVENRLFLAGIRLGALLNEIFG